MSSSTTRRVVLLACVIFLLILNTSQTSVGTRVPTRLSVEKPLEVSELREASTTRVLIRSSSDWGRILFDDLNGTNSNGIRIRSVVDSGWLEGRDSNDVLYAERKMSWPDTEYDRVVVRKGDQVAFYKGLGDFHDTEAYADLVLEVDVGLPRVYVWLMTGGNGTTTFEILNRDSGVPIWRDVVVGAGETVQVKRVMSPQSFFQPGRTETTLVEIWMAIAIVVMIILNFPILEQVTQWLRKKTRAGDKASKLGSSESRETEGATEDK